MGETHICSKLYQAPEWCTELIRNQTAILCTLAPVSDLVSVVDNSKFFIYNRSPGSTDAVNTVGTLRKPWFSWASSHRSRFKCLPWGGSSTSVNEHFWGNNLKWAKVYLAHNFGSFCPESLNPSLLSTRQGRSFSENMLGSKAAHLLVTDGKHRVSKSEAGSRSHS